MPSAQLDGRMPCQLQISLPWMSHAGFGADLHMRDSHILRLHISLGVVLSGHDFALLLIPEDDWRTPTINYSKNSVLEVARWSLLSNTETVLEMAAIADMYFTCAFVAIRGMSRNVRPFPTSAVHLSSQHEE